MVDTNVVDEPIVEEVTHNPDEVLAKIVKYDDGYHIEDMDGNVGPVLGVTKDGISLVLTENASNRKFFAIKNVEKILETSDFVPLTYKGSKKFGPAGARSTTMPNAKLISYLPEAEQEEYKAIIARAIAARDADKKKPMTELEKAQAAAERARVKYEALLAQAQGGNA